MMVGVMVVGMCDAGVVVNLLFMLWLLCRSGSI